MCIEYINVLRNFLIYIFLVISRIFFPFRIFRIYFFFLMKEFEQVLKIYYL